MIKALKVEDRMVMLVDHRLMNNNWRGCIPRVTKDRLISIIEAMEPIVAMKMRGEINKTEPLIHIDKPMKAKAIVSPNCFLIITVPISYLKY